MLPLLNQSKPETARETANTRKNVQTQFFIGEIVSGLRALRLVTQCFYKPETPHDNAVTRKNIHARFFVGETVGELRALYKFISCSNDKLWKARALRESVRQLCRDNYLNTQKGLTNLAFAVDIIYISHYITISVFAEMEDSFPEEINLVVGSINNNNTNCLQVQSKLRGFDSIVHSRPMRHYSQIAHLTHQHKAVDLFIVQLTHQLC